MTPRQRMLNAYRGIRSDLIPVAPEFWNYYPAKILGLDMLEFQRTVPFHQALKTTFEKFSCEGWGIAGPVIPNGRVTVHISEKKLDGDMFEEQTMVKTPAGELTSSLYYPRHEPAWTGERPVKNSSRDLPAWEILQFGGEPETMDVSEMSAARNEVGDSYLLEASVGMPFFDFFASGRQGGFETAIYDFLNPEMETYLTGLQERYRDRMVRIVRTLCERTSFEAFFIGCAWSCNSLIGPALWRKWDKPVIKAVADETHRHGRLLHVHFHGRCMETVADFAEIGLDCVCPFERPPGGDVKNAEGLRAVEKMLRGRTTMNGNIHTVDTLIRGTPDDVRGEVDEILKVFSGNPRLIVGTGDQVGGETPEENLRAMIETVRMFRP